MSKPRARHLYMQILRCIFTLIFISTLTGLCSHIEAQESRTYFPEPDEELYEYYYQEIPLRPGSQLTLGYTEDPSLDIFYGSLAAFFEARGRPFAEGILKNLNPESHLRIGLINLPNIDGTAISGNQIHSSFEKTLLVASAQLGFYYRHSLLEINDFRADLGLRNDLFVRGAYNMADLSPSIASLKDGLPLAQVLASYSSGLSFTTGQVFSSVGLTMGSDVRFVDLSWSILVTDFLFSDHLLEITFAPNRSVELGVAYDFASYDTLNGRQRDTITAGVTVERGASTLGIEGQYRTGDDWSLTLSASVMINNKQEQSGVTAAPTEEPDGRTELLNKKKSASFLSASKCEIPDEIRAESRSLRSAGDVAEWDKSLLYRDDLSLIEIVAVVEKARLSQHYDYGRFTSLEFNQMRSPGEYIEKGGICRDAANATANILENNGYESKIVFSKQAKASSHAFVVTKDEDGSFYLFDYEYIYGCPGAGNFQEAAASYSSFLEIYLLDPQTHRVTDIVTTPDSEYLESIAGIE